MWLEREALLSKCSSILPRAELRPIVFLILTSDIIYYIFTQQLVSHQHNQEETWTKRVRKYIRADFYCMEEFSGIPRGYSVLDTTVRKYVVALSTYPRTGAQTTVLPLPTEYEKRPGI